MPYTPPPTIVLTETNQADLTTGFYSSPVVEIPVIKREFRTANERAYGALVASDGSILLTGDAQRWLRGWGRG